MSGRASVYDTQFNIEQAAAQIEPEMQPRSGLYSIPANYAEYRETLEPILTQAFIAQPIVGNVLPTAEQREHIHMLAERTLANARRMVHLNDMGLSSFMCDVIVLAAVLALRAWNEDDASNNETLWEYIHNQFALPFEYGNFSNSPEYKVFREAIESSLFRHKRLRATRGQKYYTSLLIHALAPKIKFHTLFEQIFNFYAKNLHYHYVQDDPAFSAFTCAMKSHFEATKAQSSDAIHIKNIQSFVAIKQYFLQCPKFMSGLVERIVQQMDTLVATGAVIKTDYLDTLLVDWYEKRSREEHISHRKKRMESSSERVVTEFRNIRLSYMRKSEKVMLVIPAIRLGEERIEKPQIAIFKYEGDMNPYVEDLRYYGNSICITSSKKEVPLELLISDVHSRCFEFRAVITYGGENIFDSGKKLFRSAIVFCDNGAEILKRPGNEYVNVFAQKNCVIGGTETTADCFMKSSNGGSVYRILFDKNTDITANDEPLYPVERQLSGLILRSLVSAISHCKYVEKQHEYHIFTRQPVLEISSNKLHIEKQYRIVIDNNNAVLSDYFDSSNNCYKILLPNEKGLHDFRIIDNSTQQRIYHLPYIFYENFSIDFDGFYFTDDYCSNGSLSVSVQTDNEPVIIPYEYNLDQNVMLTSHSLGDLAVDIPLLKCFLNEQKLNECIDRVIWYEDIPAHALLELKIPRGYSATILVGSKSFASDNIEIGNIIRTGKASGTEAVGIILRSDNAPPIEIKLFDVAFTPHFQKLPIAIDVDSLQWSVENNFVGNRDTEFEILISYKGKDYEKHKFTCIDEVFELCGEVADGIYQYEINAKQPGFFSKYEQVTSGQFAIGDPNKFLFDGCAIIVTEARVENDCLPLNHSSGIIKNLQYIGEQFLNGETQHYPCYEGQLFYKHGNRMSLYATADYERNGKTHEQINPVKVWRVNEFTISLRTSADDGLYVHKGWMSITDRQPPPRKMKLSAENWIIPDFYHYKVIPLSEVENV